MQSVTNRPNNPDANPPTWPLITPLYCACCLSRYFILSAVLQLNGDGESGPPLCSTHLDIIAMLIGKVCFELVVRVEDDKALLQADGVRAHVMCLTKVLCIGQQAMTRFTSVLAPT